MRTTAGIVAFVTLTGMGWAGEKAAAPAARYSIDHVLIGRADLGRGIADVEQLTGVTAVEGGVHPGRGTQNALMSLGRGTYLEIIAPVPGQKVREDLAGLAQLERPTPVWFAVHSTDLEATKRQLESAGIATTAIEPGSRTKPDGSVLKWRTLGVEGSGLERAPFFIEWDAGSTHPSATSPGGCTLARLEMFDPGPGPLDRLVRALGIPAAVHKSDKPGLRVTLACPKGKVVFGK